MEQDGGIGGSEASARFLLTSGMLRWRERDETGVRTGGQRPLPLYVGVTAFVLSSPLFGKRGYLPC